MPVAKPGHATATPASKTGALASREPPVEPCCGSDPHRAPSPIPDYIDLFEHAPVGYMRLDASGAIETINHTGAAMLGWDAAWLIGQPFARWVESDDRGLFHTHRDRVHTAGQCLSQELRVKNRQGRILSLRLQSVPETGSSQVAAGCRSILIDVSGEQQAARKLRQLRSQIAQFTRLNTAGELATSLAHELNQPLGTVVLNCETAMRLLDGAASREYASREYELVEALAQAREAACYASEVVRHLRGFLSHTDELRTVCQLSTLVQDVSKLIEIDARDNDVDLELDIGPGLRPVSLDFVQIEQVLLNLAHNSIEALRDKHGGPRQVRITALQQSERQMLVSVEDTGPGMDAEQLQLIFTPFYTTKRDGMGMGLSISRTIIEAHGGKLWAASEPGQGAILRFTLPTTPAEQYAQ
jgi:two-component system, LuxR family, sensor kinase FixL